MNCPRCKTTIGPLASPDGVVTCPGCGARLMTRAAVLRSQGGAKPAAPAAPPERATAAPPAPAVAPADVLDTILREIRLLRSRQERLLALLERSPRDPDAADPDAADQGDGDQGDGEQEVPVTPIRARRRKSVVLIDDDPATRDAAVAELQQADVPVRAFAAGNPAIAAIAEEKPDVIVLELGIAGEMEGRDVINVVKATMEWVDIRILLWTREPVQNQKDARQVYGADEIVPKASGAAALVARIITLFRRVH